MRRLFRRGGPVTLPAARTLALPLVLAMALLLGAPSASAPHEIPPDVTVHLLVRPDRSATGDRLRVLIRVPVAALRDLELPLVRGANGEPWLDAPAATPALRDAARTWLVDYLEVREDGRRLGDPAIAALRVSPPNDRSLTDWTGAVAHVEGPPLPRGVELVPEHALLDVLLDYPVRSATTSDFSVVPGLAHLGIRTTTVLRHWTPRGTERVLQYVGDPGLVRLDPAWHHAAARFVGLGFRHILEGIDHLLFLLVLVAPFRRLGPLVPVVTAFTVAHSITLAAAALGFTPAALWFPPLIETLIAASIVWMAVENVLGAGLHRRWAVAFAFGLVHGFGFSFLLGETLQFAGGHLVAALLAFNVGVELGQLAVLAAAVPLLALFVAWIARVRGAAPDAALDRAPDAGRAPAPSAWPSPRRLATIVVSVVVAHSAWHWMTARGADLLQHDIRVPPLDLLLAAEAMRWAALGLLALAAAHLTGEAFRRLGRRLPSLLEPAPGETP